MPKEKITDIWVLGDMIGGSSPFSIQVLDRIMGLANVSAVQGNWEVGLTAIRKNGYDDLRAGGTQTAGHVYIMDSLKSHHCDFVEQLPLTKQIGDKLLFHGTLDDPEVKIDSQSHAEAVAANQDAKWIFCGHSHVSQMYKVGDKRVICVGSVGLSFDGIGGTACYVLLDGDHIVFRHVAYDVDAFLRDAKENGMYERQPGFAVATELTLKTGKNHINEEANSLGEFANNFNGTWEEAERAYVEANHKW